MLARGELTEGHARAVLVAPRRRRAPAARAAHRPRRAHGPRDRAGGAGGRREAPAAGVAPVDPALAEQRAREPPSALTGLPARVSAGKLELHFGDEKRLEELVEALEAL